MNETFKRIFTGPDPLVGRNIREAIATLRSSGTSEEKLSRPTESKWPFGANIRDAIRILRGN